MINSGGSLSCVAYVSFWIDQQKNFWISQFSDHLYNCNDEASSDMVVQLVKPVSFSYSEGASVLFVESNEEQRQHKEHIGNM